VSVAIDEPSLATTVEIAWLSLSVPEGGGAPVTAYRLRRNDGYGTSISDSYIELAGASTLSHTYTAELLIGVTYRIVVAAVNAVHTSNAFDQDGSTQLEYSDPLEITVANIPT
jgi:hypothetical protein